MGKKERTIFLKKIFQGKIAHKRTKETEQTIWLNKTSPCSIRTQKTNLL